MNDWTRNMQRAVDYIEENLMRDIRIEDIAARAYCSAFHFQRIFSAMCGVTVAEYIRLRRLTLAAQELSGEESRVIDAALKYGYDSPDSFSRAFRKFHGVSPSAARGKGVALRAFAPICVNLTPEGGSCVEYKIVDKAAFTVVGRTKTLSVENSYQTVPEFWEEHNAGEYAREICGMFGICADSNGTDFEYMIADNYIPWKEIPEGCTAKTIPAGTWAVFPCRGALEHSLQSINTKMWCEWLPNCREYKLAGNYNVEVYSLPGDNPDDYYCEIWLPIERV